jgi:hypothetical protein
MVLLMLLTVFWRFNWQMREYRSEVRLPKILNFGYLEAKIRRAGDCLSYKAHRETLPH